jgi:hypothetical protein
MVSPKRQRPKCVAGDLTSYALAQSLASRPSFTCNIFLAIRVKANAALFLRLHGC